MKFGIKNGKNYLYLVQHTLLWQKQSSITSLDDSSSAKAKKLLDILNEEPQRCQFYYTAENGNFVYSQTRSRVPHAIDSIKTKNVKR